MKNIQIKKLLFIPLIAISFMLLQNCGEKYTMAEIETQFGVMTVKLYNDTPKHRDNFIKLAKEGFYDETLFHRVINGFMIQGGDPESKGAPAGKMLGQGGPGYTLDAEIGRPHIKGALSAARLGDAQNPEKKSSGSQFYIVQGKVQNGADLQRIESFKKIKYPQETVKLYEEIGGTPNLDMDYTVFGEVVKGLDIVDKIADVATNPQNRPDSDVKMKVRIIN